MLQMPLLSLSYYDVARLGLLALTVHAAYVQVTSPGSYETRDYLYWIALSVIAYGSYKGEPLNRIVCAIVYAIVWPAITVVMKTLIASIPALVEEILRQRAATLNNTPGEPVERKKGRSEP
jgi:hypothetical protein